MERVTREMKEIAMNESKPRQPLPANAPLPLSVWLHWKGACVTVLSVGRHSETEEVLVWYTYNGECWGRPLTMWDDEARPGIKRFSPLASPVKT